MEEGLGDESGPGASGVFFFFSISLVCIGFFFFYLSVQIFALGNMRKRDRCDVYTISITSVVSP